MLINTAIRVCFLMLVNIPAKDINLIRLSKCTLYRRSVLQRLKEVRCIELKVIFRPAELGCISCSGFGFLFCLLAHVHSEYIFCQRRGPDKTRVQCRAFVLRIEGRCVPEENEFSAGSRIVHLSFLRNDGAKIIK